MLPTTFYTLMCLNTRPPYDPRKLQCFLACSGISLTSISGGTPFNSDSQQNWNKLKLGIYIYMQMDRSSLSNSWIVPWSLPWALKLNNGGRKRPLGRRVFGSRSSSKNGWIKASNCTNVNQIIHQRPKWLTFILESFFYLPLCFGGSESTEVVSKRDPRLLEAFSCGISEIEDVYKGKLVNCSTRGTGNIYVHTQSFKYLVPWMSFNLGEFKFCVIRVHALNFLPSWGS